MDVPPGNRPAVPRDWFRGVPERYVEGADTRGRLEGRPYPWSQQVIDEISGLASPNNIYGYCHNSGQGQQEKAIGEVQEHEVTYTKTKAVNSGSAEGPIDA